MFIKKIGMTRSVIETKTSLSRGERSTTEPPLRAYEHTLTNVDAKCYSVTALLRARCD